MSEYRYADSRELESTVCSKLPKAVQRVQIVLIAKMQSTFFWFYVQAKTSWMHGKSGLLWFFEDEKLFAVSDGFASAVQSFL
jgi:hypothetical protein